MKSHNLIFGVAFGFVLSRAGATNYDTIQAMFRLTDLHLMGVIGVAVLVCALGFSVIRHKHLKTPTGEGIALTRKPMVSWLIPGALLFGVGWAVSGTCPGTALAQIGEGKLAGIFTFCGILVGSYMGERLASRSQQQRVAVAPRLTKSPSLAD